MTVEHPPFAQLTAIRNWLAAITEAVDELIAWAWPEAPKRHHVTAPGTGVCSLARTKASRPSWTPAAADVPDGDLVRARRSR